MKKLFFIVTVFGALALTSCKKDWTCECSGTVMGVPFDVAESDDFKDMKKKDAKEKCEKAEEDINKVGTGECKLK